MAPVFAGGGRRQPDARPAAVGKGPLSIMPARFAFLVQLADFRRPGRSPIRLAAALAPAAAVLKAGDRDIARHAGRSAHSLESESACWPMGTGLSSGGRGVCRRRAAAPAPAHPPPCSSNPRPTPA